MKRILLLLAIFAACKKSKNDPAPVISSISPDNGVYSTIVTINGNHFSTSGATVQFNGKDARVVSATGTTITAEVPKGAGTGPVTVKTGAGTSTGPVFNYTWISSVTTFAGSTVGYADGNGTTARFAAPQTCVADAEGNIYVTDVTNQRIRKISPTGVVSTLAGSSFGYSDGTGAAAQFKNPWAICIDPQGNLYVSDLANYRIRKVTLAGVVTTFAGSGVEGDADGTGVNAQFRAPAGMCADAQGNIYLADDQSHRIRKITPAGVVTTIAGNTAGFADGTGTAARFNSPRGITIDAQGNLYVSDGGNTKIRKITPAGVVTTFAGSILGYVDATGTSARFDGPCGLAIDSSGNLFVADYGNQKIRRITPAGVVSTYAGSITGYQDGNPADARFNGPYGICFDKQGNLFVADKVNARIRKIIVE